MLIGLRRIAGDVRPTPKPAKDLLGTLMVR